MSTTIEQLEVNITSNSTSAAKGIDALASSLGKLKSITKGGVGLTTVSRQLNNLNASLNNLGGSNLNNIEKVKTALNSLSSISKSNLGSFVTPLSKLPKTMESIKSLDTNQVTTQVQQLINSFSPLINQMNRVSSGSSGLTPDLQKLIQNTDKLTLSNQRASNSYLNLSVKLSAAWLAMKKVSSVIAGWIKSASHAIEVTNQYTVSMGEYAKSAYDYAQQVYDVMGINPTEWLQNQAVFTTLAKGFGIASDRAQIMSQNLTQLGYDITSFFDLEGGFSEGMLKLQSAFAGELEPVRRLGYDLSVARLQQDAYTLGINKSVQAMTQAEKAELRYYSLMTQVSWVHGDMARTLESPTNQLRVFRSQLVLIGQDLGNFFIPLLNKVLPYLIALARVIRMVVSAIAGLFGIDLSIGVDWDSTAGSVGNVAGSANDLSDNLGEAGEKAKKLKNAMLGIDELNVISPPETSGGSGSGSGIGSSGGGLGFELPTYDFLEDAVNKRVDEILEKMKEWLGITGEITSWSDLFNTRLGDILKTVAAIATALTTWKIAKSISAFIDSLQGFNPGGLSFAGFAMFIDDVKRFVESLQDIIENGANLTNVSSLISGFAGALGTALTMLGNTKVGGALLVVDAVAGLLSAISDIAQNGLNIDNAMDAVRSIGTFITAIGIISGKTVFTGVGLLVQGIALIIPELQNLWTALTTGDWSGVDKVNLAIGAVMSVLGIVKIFSGFSKLKSAADVANGASNTVKAVTTSTDVLSTSTSTLFSKLSSLAKNLALGLVIIAEVSAAVLLVTGTIVLLGMELEQVGIAWQPVIDNGTTVAIAMGVGIGILTGIGVVTALLGSIGTTLIINVALGTAILAELGVATGLFLVEIWAIGKGLDEIGKAWQPVLDNGETIATGIAIGTALLVGIGVVTAALGIATVASVGLLPIAIGLGTAILLELGIATGLFLIEILAVGKGLDEIGKAWQPVLDNGKTIEKGIKLGTSLLIGIGVVTAALGVATVASVGLLPAAIALGTGILKQLSNSFVSFNDNLISVANKLSNDLAPSLRNLNGKLPTLTTDMSDFVDFMGDFAEEVVEYSKNNAIASITSTIDTVIGWFTTDPITKLAKDVEKIDKQTKNLNEKLKIAVPELKTAVDLLEKYTSFVEKLGELAGKGGTITLVDGLKVNLKEVGSGIVTGLTEGIRAKFSEAEKVVTTLAKNINEWFTANSYGKVNYDTFKKYGIDIINGFKDQIVSSYPTVQTAITSWANDVNTWFTADQYGKVNSVNYSGYATDIISGFQNRISSTYANSKTSMSVWANDINTWFTSDSYGKVNSTTFGTYGSNVISGFKGSISNNYHQTQEPMSVFGSSVVNWFGDQVSYKTFDKVAEDVINGFNDGIGRLYHITKNIIVTWANAIIGWFKGSLDSHSPSKIFENIGVDTVKGYNIGIESFGKSTAKVVQKWADSFTGIDPTIRFSVDTSELTYYDDGYLSRNISTTVSRSSSIAAKSGSLGSRNMGDTLVKNLETSNESQNILLREQNELLRQILAKSGVYLDGKEITKTVEKTQRERGIGILSGGVTVGI